MRIPKKGRNSSMNLLRALMAISSLTLVSRILGFVRDFYIARAFGAGLATDAFFVAFRIPNLLRRLFAEGAFSQAFVPVLAEHKNRQPPEETKTLIDGTATALFLALVAAAVLGIALSPLIVYISAPGFAADPGKFGLTVAMLRITFPYIAFISLVAFSPGRCSRAACCSSRCRFRSCIGWACCRAGAWTSRIPASAGS